MLKTFDLMCDSTVLPDAALASCFLLKTFEIINHARIIKIFKQDYTWQNRPLWVDRNSVDQPLPPLPCSIYLHFSLRSTSLTTACCIICFRRFTSSSWLSYEGAVFFAGGDPSRPCEGHLWKVIVDGRPAGNSHQGIMFFIQYHFNY